MSASSPDLPHPDVLRDVERLAVRLVSVASEIAATGFGTHVEVEYKRDFEPVTELDRRIEQLVTKSVLDEFPEHAVLGEEFGSTGVEREWTWVVDPIDGTNNFVHGIPVFALSVGVLFRRRPVFGALALPASGSVLYAGTHGGTYRDGRAVHVSDAPLSRVGMCVVPPDLDRQIEASHGAAGISADYRWLGSTAYEMAMIAEGSFQYGIFNSTAIWDVAAGLVLIQQAGGVLLRPDPESGGWTDFDGFPPAPMSLRDWNEPLLAGGPAVRELAADLRPRTTQAPRESS